MDLKNGWITVGEILAHPAAHSYLRRNYPVVLQSPLAGRYSGMPLRTAMQVAGRYIPRRRLNDLVVQLQAL